MRTKDIVSIGVIERVAVCLKRGPLTSKQIQIRTGLSRRRVCEALNQNPQLFERRETGHRNELIWTLIVE